MFYKCMAQLSQLCLVIQYNIIRLHKNQEAICKSLQDSLGKLSCQTGKLKAQ